VRNAAGHSSGRKRITRKAKVAPQEEKAGSQTTRQTVTEVVNSRGSQIGLQEDTGNSKGSWNVHILFPCLSGNGINILPSLRIRNICDQSCYPSDFRCNGAQITSERLRFPIRSIKCQGYLFPYSITAY